MAIALRRTNFLILVKGCFLVLFALVGHACQPATPPDNQGVANSSTTTPTPQSKRQTNSPPSEEPKPVIRIDKSEQAQAKRWSIIQDAKNQGVVSDVQSSRNEANMVYAGRMSATILVTSIGKWKRYSRKQQLINAVFEYYCDGIEDDTISIMEASTFEPIGLYRVRPWGLRPSNGLIFDR